MTPAISFALISLAATGCLDVTFKRFSLKERSRGMYVFGCGTVWLKLQLIYFLMNDVHVEFDQATIIYGVMTGTVLVLANILLIESLTGLDVGLGSMIYRLNTIGVVLLSFFPDPRSLISSSAVSSSEAAVACTSFAGITPGPKQNVP